MYVCMYVCIYVYMFVCMYVHNLYVCIIILFCRFAKLIKDINRFLDNPRGTRLETSHVEKALSELNRVLSNKVCCLIAISPITPYPLIIICFIIIYIKLNATVSALVF